jgi:hypothetical protein
MTPAQFARAGSVAMIIALLLSACSTGKSFKTYNDYNPDVDFRAYQTFSFISDNPMIVGETAAPVSPLLQGRIMNTIKADLSRKGFRYVSDPEQANMVISFTIGSRGQIRVDQYPANYRVGYSRYYHPYGYGMSYGTETRVRQYTEGQLAIDIFDVKMKTPAYHGSSSTKINESDRNDPQSLVDQIVAEALKGFPPGSGSSAKPTLIPTDPVFDPNQSN